MAKYRRAKKFSMATRCGYPHRPQSFVQRHKKRDGVRNLLFGDFLVFQLQHASAALGNAGSVIGEVEHEGELTWRERIRAFQTETLQAICGWVSMSSPLFAAI